AQAATGTARIEKTAAGAQELSEIRGGEGNPKSQTPSSKHQKPSSKHQRNPKLQIPILPATSPPWSLRFETFLVFGAWCLVFRYRCFGLGVSTRRSCGVCYGLYGCHFFCGFCRTL